MSIQLLSPEEVEKRSTSLQDREESEFEKHTAAFRTKLFEEVTKVANEALIKSAQGKTGTQSSMVDFTGLKSDKVARAMETYWLDINPPLALRRLYPSFSVSTDSVVVRVAYSAEQRKRARVDPAPVTLPTLLDGLSQDDRADYIRLCTRYGLENTPYRELVVGLKKGTAHVVTKQYPSRDLSVSDEVHKMCATLSLLTLREVERRDGYEPVDKNWNGAYLNMQITIPKVYTADRENIMLRYLVCQGT
jgi:hypothetical protein